MSTPDRHTNGGARPAKAARTEERKPWSRPQARILSSSLTAGKAPHASERHMAGSTTLGPVGS